MLPECCHEVLKVVQFQNVIMESDHPLHYGPLQCHGHKLHFDPFG